MFDWLTGATDWLKGAGETVGNWMNGLGAVSGWLGGAASGSAAGAQAGAGVKVPKTASLALSGGMWLLLGVGAIGAVFMLSRKKRRW